MWLSKEIAYQKSHVGRPWYMWFFDKELYYESMKTVDLTPIKIQIIRPFLAQVRKNSELLKPTILDAGSGIGQITQAINDELTKVYSFDLSQAGLLEQSVDLRVRARAAHLPYASNVFDGVFSKDMIVHFDNQQLQHFFNEASRTLKRNGILEIMFAVGNVNNMGPLQFDHDPQKIINYADKSGLALKSRFFWKPEKEDWYRSEITRTVMDFVKR